jgi:hypothetical protein
VQVAITPEQARKYDLKSAPPKPNDRRGQHFTDTETWQAEALDPHALAEILAEVIRARLDLDVYQVVLAEEAEVRQALMSQLGP